MEYLLHILILIGIYIIVGISLNLVAGYTGLISVAHAAFYGIGAYTAALLSLNFGINFTVAIPIAIVVSALFGFLIGFPSLRIRDDFFVIATFGFQVIIFQIMNNWMELTHGPLGLPGIPQPKLFGYRFTSHVDFLLLTLVFAVLVFFIARRLVQSPFGNVLRAIREDEIFAQSLGKNVNYYKVMVFSIGAGLVAIGGALYAYYITFIDPTSFTVPESIFMLSIVIVGGAGRLSGSIIGAILLVSIPELLRFLGMPSSVAANMRQILYGGLLVAFMMFRPQGIWGEFSFRRE
ncbi:MAG: branched-chain amino acid ABC transporter permease [Ignavibacteriae bacterium]|nr:branched-chain amino acid ABC transporter permease [Ignavibacteriota bacterium]